MAARYERAARLTAPRMAAQVLERELALAWLDNGRLLFAANSEAATHAKIVDCASGVITAAPATLVPRLALGGGGTEAIVSPDGCRAARLQGFDVCLKDVATGALLAATNDGAEYCAYARQSETGLSAISHRANPTPVGLWSPDSEWFVTHRIDERHLPDLALLQHVPADGVRPKVHSFKYPLPGDPFPVATLMALHASSGQCVSFDEFAFPVAIFSPFSLRTAWFAADGALWFIGIDETFKRAELIRLDLAAASGRVVVRETSADAYFDPQPVMARRPNVRVLERRDEILWYSDRDGAGHIYRYRASTGQLLNRVTSGRYRVRDIVHVDERVGDVFFLAAGLESDVDPAQRALCRIGCDGERFEVLVLHAGDVSIVPGGVSPDGRYCVIELSSLTAGDSVEVVDLSSGRRMPLRHVPPEIDGVQVWPVSEYAADGTTRLHGAMFLPADFDAVASYPLIDYIYPGPHVAHAPQSVFASDAGHARALAHLGFVTIMIDTRGTPVGDRAFHKCGYGAFLEPQLADHAAFVTALCDRYAFLDGARVGIFGYSGGGFAAMRALCDYGEVFKVGVAACGNYDSNLYTASWAAKYLGPGKHDGTIDRVAKLRGQVLLITGDMDENVHPAQTLSLVHALIRANRDFELLVVPNEGHSVLTTNGYALRRAWDFLARNLLPQAPPREFELAFTAAEIDRYWRAWLGHLR